MERRVMCQAVAAIGVASVAVSGCTGIGLGRPFPDLGGPVAGSEAVARVPDWWSAFGSRILSDPIERALADNPMLDEVAARVRKAGLLARAESARGLPAIDVTAAWRHGREQDRTTDFESVDVDPWQSSADASWELDLFGKIRARRRSADAAARIAHARLEAARLDLSADTADARLTQLRLNEERAIVAEIRDASESIAQILRERVGAGVASDLEARRHEAESENLRRAVIELDRHRDAAAVRMAALTGQPPGAASQPAATLSSDIRVPDLPDAVPLDAIGRRPDLAAAHAEVAQTYFAENAARLDLYPSLSLDFSALGAGGSLTGPFQMWRAAGGPTLRLPALDPAARIRARAAQAETDAAVHAWEGAVLEALAEVESAAIDYRSRRRQLASAEAESAALENVWQQTRVNLDAGVVSHLEVLEDQRQYLAARRAAVALRHQLALDYIAVAKAMGGALPGVAGRF